MRRKLTSGLALGALLRGSQASHAKQPPVVVGNDDPSVDRAIAAVYPALVQIYVVTVAHWDGRERKFEAAGSGAIVSTDGYVVTNHHVAGKAKAVRCILSTREEVDAVLIGTDALSDIAVLKLDLSTRKLGAPPLPVARFGSSEALKVGDPVLAMGCPLALTHSVTRGIVANKDLMMPRWLERAGGSFSLDGENVGSIVKWIGHDATIQGGNSGGPLVNLTGEIVGINEIGLGTMSGAIPSEVAQSVAEELRAHGKVRRAWLGAEFQSLLKGAGPGVRGVLVAGVLPGSPAERAGLKPGDRVIAVDGAPVSARFREELPAFQLLLLSKPPGHMATLTVVRDGQEQDLQASMDPRDDAEGKHVEVKEWGISALEITTVTAMELRRPSKRGVLVGSIRPGAGADQAQPALHGHDAFGPSHRRCRDPR
jgi:serine protease Do